jgi:hypothetical protein
MVTGNPLTNSVEMMQERVGKRLMPSSLWFSSSGSLDGIEIPVDYLWIFVLESLGRAEKGHGRGEGAGCCRFLGYSCMPRGILDDEGASGTSRWEMKA